MVEYITAVIANTGIDRFRGSAKEGLIKPDVYASAAFGCLLCWLMALPVYWALILAVAYKAGEALGWGHPLGPYMAYEELANTGFERYQVGILKTNPELALLARGFIWGFPIAASIAFVSWAMAFVVLFAFTITFLAAPWAVRPFYTDGRKRWKVMEEVRGAMVMVIICVGLALL